MSITLVNCMNMRNNRGPNDLEWIIERLKKENYKLEMEVEMLKEDIAFLKEQLKERAFEGRNDW
jgi:hypothetical protein